MYRRCMSCLTSIYKGNCSKEQRGKPDYKHSWDRIISSCLATDLFDDVETMALYDVVYMDVSVFCLYSDMKVTHAEP